MTEWCNMKRAIAGEGNLWFSCNRISQTITVVLLYFLSFYSYTYVVDHLRNKFVSIISYTQLFPHQPYYTSPPASLCSILYTPKLSHNLKFSKMTILPKVFYTLKIFAFSSCVLYQATLHIVPLCSSFTTLPSRVWYVL